MNWVIFPVFDDLPLSKTVLFPAPPGELYMGELCTWEFTLLIPGSEKFSLLVV
jgi:hypothetical protein